MSDTFQPTPHLRWAETWAEKPSGANGLMLRERVKVLQQFWERTGPNVSDITMVPDIGPDGREGRWRDVPTALLLF